MLAVRWSALLLPQGTPADAQPSDPQKFAGASVTGPHASLTCWNADHHLAVTAALSAGVRPKYGQPGPDTRVRLAEG